MIIHCKFCSELVSLHCKFCDGDDAQEVMSFVLASHGLLDVI